MCDEQEQIEAIWNAVDGQYEDEVYLYRCYQKDGFISKQKGINSMMYCIV
jgi:hypothetical protein